MDTTINETETLELTCAAFGVPIPNITWISPADVQFSTVMTDNTTAYTNTSVLTVLNTSSSSEGVYTCMASNTIGEDQQANAAVIVQSELNANIFMMTNTHICRK